MKQRKPVSKIYYTAMYLHHMKSQTEFTCSQLYDAQQDAYDYYNARNHPDAIDEPTYSPNVFSGDVTTQHKIGYLDRNDACSPYIYFLPERYIRHWMFAECNGFVKPEETP